MTLCSALVLVVVYFFEQWWFAIAFERVPMLSALGLAGAVAAYGALSAEEAKAEAAAKRAPAAVYDVGRWVGSGTFHAEKCVIPRVPRHRGGRAQPEQKPRRGRGVNGARVRPPA